jgi:hypothetical protein
MSPRLQRRDWLHLQRFTRCLVLDDLQRGRLRSHDRAHRCTAGHSQRLARALMNRSD